MDFRTDTILRNKLVTATPSIEECRLAQQNGAPIVEGVIADLHTSISTAPSKDADGKAKLAALFTNRRRFDRFNRKGKNGGRQCEDTK